MADFDDLLAQVPIDKIAAELGVDPTEAQAAVQAALPTLVGGLKHHADKDELPLEALSSADGKDIVHQALGGKADDVAAALGEHGVDSGLVQKVLPILAPIVLSWLMGKMSGAGSATGGSGGGILGDILGQVLGGATGAQPKTQPKAESSGGGVGDVIGDVLGKILKGN